MDAKEIFQDGQYYFMRGSYEEAIQKFSEAIEAGADQAVIFLSRGVAYVKTKEMEKAINDFGEVLARDNRNIRAYYYRGIARMSQEENQGALADLNEAIALDPEHGAAHLARGTVYSLLGEEEKSAMDMKTAIMKSEVNMQGFAESFGIFRTQFHKVMAQMEGEGENDPTLMLSEEELNTVKKWMEE